MFRKLILFWGLLVAGLFTLQPTRIASPALTPTPPEDRLALQVQQDISEFPASRNHDELCQNQAAVQQAQLRTLAHLISSPDAQSRTLSDLAAIYEANSGYAVEFLAGGADEVLAFWYPLRCFPPSHGIPGTMHYVISRSGAAWAVGWRLTAMQWVGDRWIARYNPTELSYAAAPSALVHIEQQDGAWINWSYIAFPPESASFHSSIRLENITADRWQVVLSFARYNLTPPCDFVGEIDFYSSIQTVERAYQWDGAAYTPLGDEAIISTSVFIRLPDARWGETYQELGGWGDYCSQ